MATKKKAKRAKKKIKVIAAKRCNRLLKNLLAYAVGNRGSREGNPYMKPEVKAAAKALGEI
jgi:hypothetical protein